MILISNHFVYQLSKLKNRVKTLKKQPKKKFAFYVNKIQEKIDQIFL